MASGYGASGATAPWSAVLDDRLLAVRSDEDVAANERLGLRLLALDALSAYGCGHEIRGDQLSPNSSGLSRTRR